MKKFVALSVIAVCMSGGVRAASDFRSVAQAVMVMQGDNELQDQAQKSIKQIVGAAEDFILLASKKIAEGLDTADKKALQETLTQIEALIERFKLVSESGDSFSLTPQEQQMYYKRVIPLVHVLEGTIAMLLMDEAFAQELFGDLSSDIQRLITQTKKSL